MTAFCLVFIGVVVLQYMAQGRKLELLECRLWENRVSKRDLVELSLRRNRRLYLSRHNRLYWRMTSGGVVYVSYRTALKFIKESDYYDETESVREVSIGHYTASLRFSRY